MEESLSDIERLNLFGLLLRRHYRAVMDRLREAPYHSVVGATSAGLVCTSPSPMAEGLRLRCSVCDMTEYRAEATHQSLTAAALEHGLCVPARNLMCHTLRVPPEHAASVSIDTLTALAQEWWSTTLKADTDRNAAKAARFGLMYGKAGRVSSAPNIQQLPRYQSSKKPR